MFFIQFSEYYYILQVLNPFLILFLDCFLIKEII